jgi:hypothetical protein
MTDPIMISVASALAGKAAEAAADGGKSALAALARLVRSRATSDKTASAALDAAASKNPASVDALARALERLAAADPEFRAQLRDLWPQASAELSASEGGVVNSNTGTVGGHLIQAGDLHADGGLHLGDVYGPRQP